MQFKLMHDWHSEDNIKKEQNTHLLPSLTIQIDIYIILLNLLAFFWARHNIR